MAGVFTVARPEIICALITIIVIIFGCLAMFGAIYVKNNNIFLSSIAAELVLSCYWRFGPLCNPLSFYAIDNDYESYDYGTNDYVRYGLLDSVNSVIKGAFPKANWLIERVEESCLDAEEKIEKGDFSCVAIMDGNPCGIKCDFVVKSGHYKLLSEVDLQTGSQIWHVYIYVNQLDN